MLVEVWPKEVYVNTAWHRNGDNVREHDVVVTVDEKWKANGGSGSRVKEGEEMVEQNVEEVAFQTIRTETPGPDDATIRATTRHNYYVRVNGEGEEQLMSLFEGIGNLRIIMEQEGREKCTILVLKEDCVAPTLKRLLSKLETKRR